MGVFYSPGYFDLTKATELKSKLAEVMSITGKPESEIFEYLKDKYFGLSDLHSFVKTYKCLPNKDALDYIKNWGFGFVITQYNILRHRFENK